MYTKKMANENKAMQMRATRLLDDGIASNFSTLVEELSVEFAHIASVRIKRSAAKIIRQRREFAIEQPCNATQKEISSTSA